MNKRRRIAILGLGWLGEPLANALVKEQYEVNGSTTSIEKLYQLAKNPYYSTRLVVNPEGIEGDWQTFIAEVDVLVINFPPKRIDDIESIFPAQVQQIIAQTPPSVRVVFVSSTSVYGDLEGLVTEKQVCEPTKASGKALIQAEALLKNHFSDNLTVLRLAGLIGPQRHPGRFLAGKRQLKQADAVVNLIHQEDCIFLIKEIIAQDAFGKIINGCADEHPTRRSYYTKAAEALNLDAPVFGEEGETSSKIVDNTYSKELLGINYEYASPEQIFDQEKLPVVSIAGVGPGDIGLLTVKAYQSIKEAEVLLYDNLVSEEIMALNQTGEKIYVGRKYGDVTPQMTRQDAINNLILTNYKQGKKVVRLKSGDPYIYGRAAEEAIFLKEHEIVFEMIPGITSALAAANKFNIPVTQRKQSNAVLFCTGHLAEDSLDQLNSAAQLLREGNSVALYMASKKIHDITEKLIDLTGNPDIPVCAISSVSTPRESMLTSTLGQVEFEIEKQALPLPVVFLIGHNPIT